MERVEGHARHCLPVPENTSFDGNLEKNNRHHFAEHDAAYVRLPSEHETEPILRFSYGGIKKDWLRQKNKGVFGLFKQGLRESLEEEQALVAGLLATPRRKSTSIKLITTTAGVPPQDLLHKLRRAQL